MSDIFSEMVKGGLVVCLLGEVGDMVVLRFVPSCREARRDYAGDDAD